MKAHFFIQPQQKNIRIIYFIVELLHLTVLHKRAARYCIHGRFKIVPKKEDWKANVCWDLYTEPLILSWSMWTYFMCCRGFLIRLHTNWKIICCSLWGIFLNKEFTLSNFLVKVLNFTQTLIFLEDMLKFSNNN